MKGLAELVVSLCDLCEAEGRLLEEGILRTVRRAGLISLGLLFGAAALALLLCALYAFLAALLPTPAALALLGCASAAVAGLFLWRGRGVGADARAEGVGRGERPVTDAAPHPEDAPVAPAPKGRRGVWDEAAPYGRHTSLRNRGSGGSRQGARA